ncbi:MAG: 50S ribosomal protein L11 [Nanoarchaeota archaeon]
MIIKILADGGSMKPGPALSQKLGPAGINLGMVISKVNEATSEFKGMKVPVELDVDIKTKTFKVHVASPPVSALLKKELNLEKASGDHKNNVVGNASIEQIISIAKMKHPNMLAKDLKGAVKSVTGTCVSLGILVENMNAKDAVKEIDKGKYDPEIKSGKTETSQEKLKELNYYLNNIKEQQEKAKQAKLAAEAAAAATTETTEATAAATTSTEAKTPVKAEEKTVEKTKPAAKAKK